MSYKIITLPKSNTQAIGVKLCNHYITQAPTHMLLCSCGAQLTLTHMLWLKQMILKTSSTFKKMFYFPGIFELKGTVLQVS